MRFDCGEEWEEKKSRLEQWHPFFTVLPRKVGPHDCRFLEWVERKGTYYAYPLDSFWLWKFRAKT